MARNFRSITDPDVARLLREGAVGVLPTDTVYGVACRAADPVAVKRLYDLKKREHKPGTLVAASIEQLVELGMKARYLKAVESYWPNPLTIIIPAEDPALSYLHQGKWSLGVRLPKDTKLVKFLQVTGPLLTSSANHPGETPANTSSEAHAYFGDNVDFYVDGGDMSGQQPSTIMRVVDDAIEVLRPGAVTIDETTGRITS